MLEEAVLGPSPVGYGMSGRDDGVSIGRISGRHTLSLLYIRSHRNVTTAKL